MTDTIGSVWHPALTDEQTGLPNRLHFDTVFEVVFAIGSRGIPVTIILLEIEGFDEWAGKTDESEAGKVLRSMASTLGPVVRQTDLLARYDEAIFSVCLIDCNMAGGVLVADRIDGILDSTRDETGLRFSMGCAVFDADMERGDDLRVAAEASLKTAQIKGGDQIDFHR